MPRDWQELTRLTGGRTMVVERVRLSGTATRIEGEFDLPPLVGLAAEDQVFVAAFVHNHGSIKGMEKMFGISYPTVKNRLNRIAAKLPLIEVEQAPSRMEALARLDRGEINVKEALELLEEGEKR